MTETLILQRQPSTDQGTFGQIFRDGKQICVTGELPWLNNEHGKSCIPGGLYLCIPHTSPEHPNTWEVTGVPNRTEILLHNGNVPIPYINDKGIERHESLGCILVGNTYGNINGRDAVMKAVMNSLLTLDRLREELPNTFYLYIKNSTEKDHL